MPFLVLVALVVPLALAPGLAYFDITPKLLALFAGGGLVSAWAAMRGSPGNRTLDALLGVQALAAMGATLWSVAPEVSLAGSDWRRLGLPAILATLVIAAAVPRLAGHRRRQMLAWTTGAGAAAALYALAQYAGFDPWIERRLYTIGEGEWAIVRPPATLGYVSYLAVFLCYTIFPAVALALTAQRRVAAALWCVAAAVAAGAVLITGARGAWAGAAVGAAILLAGAAGRRKILAATLLFAALAAVFVLTPAGEPVRSRFRWFVEDPGGGSRAALWRDTWRMCLAQPRCWVGFGPDTFERTFPPYVSEELARRFPDRYFESPHNMLLDALTSTGAAGVLALAGLVLLAVRRLWSGGDPLSRAILASLAAGVVAQQFHAETLPTRLYLLLFVGLAFEPGTEAQAGRMRYWGHGAAVALLGLALWPGVRLVRAERALHAAREAAARRDLDTVVTATRAASDAFPWGGTYALASSRLLGNFAALPAPSGALFLALAEEQALRALPRIAGRQLAAVHLASLYAVQGKLAPAEQMLRRAVADAPQWHKPRYLLAELLHAQGRKDEARAAAEMVLRLTPREHPAQTKCREILARK
jgi:O-antigen ligase